MEYDKISTLTADSNIDWKIVIDELKEDRGVLFLGPDILEEQSDLLSKPTAKRKHHRFQIFYDSEIPVMLKDKIQKYYPEHNLFRLDERQSTTRIWIEKHYKSFYEAEVNREVFEKLVDLPFRLIISVNPDQNFVKIYNTVVKSKTGKSIDHYAYNDRSNIPYKGWDRIPDYFFPVYFSLMGDITESNSFVLTHEDLFRRMRNLFCNRFIPREFHLAMKEIRFGIFLGFRFDMWYYWILINFLEERLHLDSTTDNPDIYKSSNSGIFKFSNKYKIRDPYFNDVCGKVLNISFSNFSLTELTNELYTRCHDEEILRSQMFDKKSKIYISYSHQTREEYIEKKTINQICERLKKEGYLPVFDEKIGPRTDIFDFIQEMSRSDKVVIILNEHYLKSRYCMIELTTIYTTHGNLKTIYPFSEPTTVEQCLTFFNHWTNELAKHENGRGSADGIYKELLLIHENYRNIIHELFRKVIPDNIDDLILSLSS